jgi:DNA-binding LytR/AlgR family response regulator
MRPLRALLVDDEPLAVRRLTLALADVDDVEIVDSTTSARRAIALIASLQPDIVFLDIAMPGLNGFDVVESSASSPAIVFVTAYENHAVRAFSIDAADYLLKPVAPERLRIARTRRAEPRGEEAHVEAPARLLYRQPLGAPSPGVRPRSDRPDRLDRMATM